MIVEKMTIIKNGHRYSSIDKNRKNIIGTELISMVDAYSIVARVTEVRNENGNTPCDLYKIGDEFDLAIPEEKEKICRWAYNSIFPIKLILEFGGKLPWEPDPTVVSCPNPHRVVVFQLRRESVRKVDSCCWK
ncbi:MAG: TIGR04076 family protein [Candidatus Thorarchaeota archaeon]